MNLKDPMTGIEFIVTPNYFLGAFDVHDREEGLGEELNEYNPNDCADLKALFHKYFFEGKLIESYRVEHKAVLAKVLIDVLKNPNFDFNEVVEDECDSVDGFSLPGKWEIKNLRIFFLEAYIAIFERWGEELQDYGFPLISPDLLEN